VSVQSEDGVDALPSIPDSRIMIGVGLSRSKMFSKCRRREVVQSHISLSVWLLPTHPDGDACDDDYYEEEITSCASGGFPHYREPEVWECYSPLSLV
jgi:hypothetical protein